MKVTGLKLIPADVPFEKPVHAANWVIKSAGVVAVLVETDAGIVGEGLVFSLNAARLKVLAEGVRSFEPLLIGLDPAFSGAFLSAALKDIRFFGHKSSLVMSLSGIEAALWDIRAKAAGLPMHKLIGAVRDSVPVYWSGGLWIGMSIDELQREAEAVVNAGYRAMKARTSRGDVEVMAHRVKAIREAVGPDVQLMVDSNQTLDVAGALKLARRLAEYDLTWFEEPVPYYDHAAEAEIAAASPIPIASGESEFLSVGMQEMIDRRCAHTLMPDLQRMGGIAEFVKSGHLAEHKGIAISSHLFTEMSIGLLAAVENATWLEYMPWFEGAYADRLTIKDGHVRVPDRPGHAVGLDLVALARHRLD